MSSTEVDEIMAKAKPYSVAHLSELYVREKRAEEEDDECYEEYAREEYAREKQIEREWEERHSNVTFPRIKSKKSNVLPTTCAFWIRDGCFSTLPSTTYAGLTGKSILYFPLSPATSSSRLPESRAFEPEAIR